MHGAGLLHRDVKAQNVMREGGGRIVLMDFGTGEDLSSGTSRLVGTPLYLAPEIFAGQKASIQSDIYSLGVMLFYLVTGNFPVTAATMEQLRQAHVNRQRRTLRDLRPDVPEAFIRVVERALDSDPSRRFHSIGELEQGLRESLDRVPAPRVLGGRGHAQAARGAAICRRGDRPRDAGRGAHRLDPDIVAGPGRERGDSRRGAAIQGHLRRLEDAVPG